MFSGSSTFGCLNNNGDTFSRADDDKHAYSVYINKPHNAYYYNRATARRLPNLDQSHVSDSISGVVSMTLRGYWLGEFRCGWRGSWWLTFSQLIKLHSINVCPIIVETNDLTFPIICTILWI